MAIAFDAASSRDGATNISYSWSHTCTGANLILVVGVSIVDSGGGGPAAVTGITYNSVALTLIRRGLGGSSNATEMWRLIAPATGANTIAVTLSQAPVQNSMGGAVSLTGVHQTTPVDASNAATSSAGNASVSVTTVAANAWLVDTMVDNGGDASAADSPQVEAWNLAGNSRRAGGSYRGPVVTPGATTMSWTSASTGNWGITAVSFAPTAAVAGNPWYAYQQM